MQVVGAVTVVREHDYLLDIAQVNQGCVQLHNSVWLRDKSELRVDTWDYVQDLLAGDVGHLVVQRAVEVYVADHEAIEHAIVSAEVLLGGDWVL